MKIQVFDIDIPGSVAAGEATAKEQRCAWLVRNDPEATPNAGLDALVAVDWCRSSSAPPQQLADDVRAGSDPDEHPVHLSWWVGEFGGEYRGEERRLLSDCEHRSTSRQSHDGNAGMPPELIDGEGDQRASGGAGRQA
jgi:hypothetical protein